MPIARKYLADFNENGIYHVYNRTNNREKLFLSDENRYFFLKKYDHYLSPFIDTYCWCLLPNHFHLLTKVKPVKTIQTNLQAIGLSGLTLTEERYLLNKITTSELIEHSFKRFFQSYSLSINNFHDRKGNLFHKPFKRVEVIEDTQFIQTVAYIHLNPVKHGLIKDFTQYQWSSWRSLLSNSPTRLLRTEVLERFGGLDLFIRTHTEMTESLRVVNLSKAFTNLQ